MYVRVRVRLNWKAVFFSSLHRVAIIANQMSELVTVRCISPTTCVFYGIVARCRWYRCAIYCTHLYVAFIAMIKSTNQCITRACKYIIILNRVPLVWNAHTARTPYTHTRIQYSSSNCRTLSIWYIHCVCTLQFFANVFYILIFDFKSISTYQKRIISSVNSKLTV